MLKLLRRAASVRLQLWEVLLILCFAALAFTSWSKSRIDAASVDREARFLHERYGPSHNSENEEEWIIRDFFKDRRNGFFVDVGANHYQRLSKTYYLETALGWSGLAVEPLKEFAAEYGKYRPRTRFMPFFVAEKSDATATMYVIDSNTSVSSSNREFTSRFGEPTRTETVPTISLNDLLDRARVPAVDLLSIDIELHEPSALAGFDIRRFQPALVCIEALLPVRQQILNYFAGNGYVIYGRYLRADRENLYFVPLAAAERLVKEQPQGALEGLP